MPESKPARPPQVTLAGCLVMAGSVLVVLMAFSDVATLRSLDTREAVEKRVADSGGDFFGLDVQGVLTAMRVLLMVAAASATATAILGWHVLRRSRGARIALSLLAGPLFVAGLVQQGGFVSAMVTAAIVMLWFQPARDWFDGITREPPARRPEPTPAPDPPSPSLLASLPGPSDRSPLLDLPPPTAPPLHPTPYAQAGRTVVTERPRSVVWACIVVWVATATVFAGLALFLVDFAVDPHPFMEQFRQQNPQVEITDSDLHRLIVVFCAVGLAWAAAAAGVAVLVWRRVPWAAVVLGVSAALSCVVLLPIPAAVAAGVLLLRPETRAWLTGRP